MKGNKRISNHQGSTSKNANSGVSREKENPTYLYASNGSIVQDFINRRENFIDAKTERRHAVINRYGFIAALIDGFNSDGNKRLDINLSEITDLSINQSAGFSVFFWFLCKKQTEGIHRYIIKKGSTDEEMTPAVGILPNGTNIFVKMNSSKNRVENLFSNKKIEANRMYSVLATFSIDYHNDLTDISLYLDGTLDSQVTVPGEPVHNQGNLFIGRCDNINYGFVGSVADIILMPRVITDEEIRTLHYACLNNFKSQRIIQSYQIFCEHFEREYLISKYMEYTGNPTYVIENMQMTNDELKEIVKNFDEDLRREMESQKKEEEKASEEARIISKLKTYLGENDSDLSATFKKLAANSSFIYSVLYLVNEMQDELSPKRIQIVFEILSETFHFHTDEKIIFDLAKILNSLTKSESQVKLLTFFKSIQIYISNIFPDFKLNDIVSYGNTSKTNFGETNNLFNDANPYELHENLLRSSQNFKNYCDEEIEKELGKSSTFSIRSLYTRNKSARPYTAKVQFTDRIEDTDLVNQNFEDISEKKNELAEVIEEMENVEKYSASKEPRTSDKNLEIQQQIINDIPKEIGNLIEDIKQKEHSGVIIEVKNKDVHENIPLNEHPEEHKSSQPNTEKNSIITNKENINFNENTKENNDIHQIENDYAKTKFSDRLNNSFKKDTTNSNYFRDSGMPTNNEDIFSQFENKVIINSSGRDTHKFSDVEVIPIENMMLSHDIHGDIDLDGNLNISNDIMPRYSSDWAQGQFELVIDHCYDCHNHKLSTRHFEYSFIDKFNEIGENIKSVFPNIKIVGNHGKPDYYGCFDVYLRGVGPRLDDKHRFFIFRKISSKKFPTKFEVLDRLIALTMLYGSSVNMQAAQIQYFKSYKYNIPKPSKRLHEHPISYSEDTEKEKQEFEKSLRKMQEIDPERTKFSCLNWGCNAVFVKVDNGQKVCQHHPGVWQFGSYNAYWPEAWSCCEGKWEDPGCTLGPHKGVKLNKRLFLCVNHGNINPRTQHPDSACGSYFTLNDQESCKFHPGFVKHSTWTCCNSGKELVEGCQKGKHFTASWPDEIAKLNFYPKPLDNPGLGENYKNFSVSQLIIKCDFFKPIKQYDNPVTKLELLKLKREKEKDEPRYCLRWACEKIYKNTQNHNRACLCHSGKWDHGSTGTKLVNFVKDFADPKSLEKNSILWHPHWTCCRGSWDSPGCRRMAHRGPLLDEYMQNNPRKFKWPDVRLKLYFPKVVSEKWKNSLNKYLYSEERVRDICNKFFSTNRTLIDIPRLCDSLRLYLLVVSDNIEYQMKFMDVASQAGSVYYFISSSGYVDKEKFIQWWFSSYEKIIEENTKSSKNK